MARPKKPTALRLIQGNPGKRAINHQEPIIPPADVSPPAHLSGRASAEWRRIAPLLLDAGVLTRSDTDALGIYCEALGRLAEAHAHLQETGYLIRSPNGYPIQNPWYAVMKECHEVIRAFGNEFGMTPASRSKIRVDDSKLHDEFETYLSRGKT